MGCAELSIIEYARGVHTGRSSYLYPPRLDGAAAGAFQSKAFEKTLVNSGQHIGASILLGVVSGAISTEKVSVAWGSEFAAGELIALAEHALSALADRLNGSYLIGSGGSQHSGFSYDLEIVDNECGGYPHLALACRQGVTLYDIPLPTVSPRTAELIALSLSLLQSSGCSFLTTNDAIDYIYYLDNFREDFKALVEAGVDVSDTTSVMDFLHATDLELESFDYIGNDSPDGVEEWLDIAKDLTEAENYLDKFDCSDVKSMCVHLQLGIHTVRDEGVDSDLVKWLEDVLAFALIHQHRERYDNNLESGDFDERRLGENVLVGFGSAVDGYVAGELHEGMMNDGEDSVQRFQIEGLDSSAFSRLYGELEVEAQGIGYLDRLYMVLNQD